MNIQKGISVIIPAYKRNRLLISCLNSILQQKVLPNEIIVVNNALDKNLIALIRKVQKKQK